MSKKLPKCLVTVEIDPETGETSASMVFENGPTELTAFIVSVALIEIQALLNKALEKVALLPELKEVYEQLKAEIILKSYTEH